MKIEIDSRGLERADTLLKDLPKAADKVKKKAMRQAFKGIKQAALKEIASSYTLQKSRASGTMSTSYRGSSAIFSSRGRVNDLSYFKHSPAGIPKHRPPSGKYLYSQVVKGAGGTIAHAFLARMSSGHIGVFQRAAHGAVNSSLPIQKMTGPSTPQMLSKPAIRQHLESRVSEKFSIAVDREIAAYLERL